MRLVFWLRLFAAAWLLGAAATATAQERDPEGLWALRADGRILAVLDLRRDGQAPGGWTGAWTKPERMTVNDSNLAFDIGGATVVRPIMAATVRGDRIELTVPGRQLEDAPNVFSFRVVDPETAELGWRDAPIAPMTLARVPAGTTVDTGWDSGRSYVLASPPRRSNPEMTAIYEADQADRQAGGANIDWAAVAPRDAARRARTLQLLDAGALRSGDDFHNAAFVFQHGDTPDDILLAHTFAVLAAARDRPDAAWIAAASLDRYLQRIGQPQIYGTQFNRPPGQPTTQEPYNRTLVSDALRPALGVPTQAQQEERRAAMEASYRARQPSRPLTLLRW